MTVKTHNGCTDTTLYQKISTNNRYIYMPPAIILNITNNSIYTARLYTAAKSVLVLQTEILIWGIYNKTLELKYTSDEVKVNKDRMVPRENLLQGKR